MWNIQVPEQNWNSNWKGYGSRTGIGTVIKMILVPELELEQ